MSQEQSQRPVTYGDVFPVQGALANMPITREDAGLMQSAEALALGCPQEGGAGSIMQAAAERNVRARVLEPDAHSAVAEVGVSVVDTIIPGGILHTECIAGQPAIATAVPIPLTIPSEGDAAEPITIGEALEAAALGAGDAPVEPSDARAIQSAEKRATGQSATEKGGLAATAQSAADLNPRVESFGKTTLSDILTDASVDLSADKVATQEDADKVRAAECRGRENVREGGVSAAVQAAANLNEKIGVNTSPTPSPTKKQDAANMETIVGNGGS